MKDMHIKFKNAAKITLLVILLCTLIGCKSKNTSYKYKDLKISDIKEAYVKHDWPKEITYYLDDKDIEKAVKYLNNFSSSNYKKHNSEDTQDGNDTYILYLITSSETISIKYVSLEFIILDGEAYDLIYWFFPLRSIFSKAKK